MFFLTSFFQIVSFAVAQSTIDAQNATVSSLVYGYPLLAWQTLYSAIVQDIGANTWSHGRELSTPANRTVVKPNVDTLYSQVIYDLSQSDLEISIPDVPATNFKLFSFYDPYGDNYVDVGTGGFYKPGTYLVTPLERSRGGAVGLQVLNGSYQVGTVTSPTIYGVLLVRWGLNQTDISTVHQRQDQCSSQIMAASKNLTGVTLPKLESLISVYNTSASPAENVMSLLPHYLPPNAPAAQFEAAGISVSNATYTPQSPVNLTFANATAVAIVAEAAVDPNVEVAESNGWGVLSPTLIGVYGKDYGLRTVVAESGYLALRNPYAVYPTWTNESQSNATAALTLGSDEGIIFTFSGKPPLQEAGFWSLTAYDEDYFLIPNMIDVYALGDRSNLTYPDGSRVYYGSASNSSNKNGVFQILLQPADVKPPANWATNWLPAPTGGGAVIPQLRWYVAQHSLVNGSYVYPELQRIAAITTGNETSSGTSSTTSSLSASTTGSMVGSSGSLRSPTSSSPSPSASTGSKISMSLLGLLLSACAFWITLRGDSMVLSLW